jgi:hypothetical protein
MQRLSRSLFSRHSELECTATRFHCHQGWLLEELQLAIFNISLRLVDFWGQLAALFPMTD